VLIAIIKKRLNLAGSLHTLLQILSISIFEKVQLFEALTCSDSPVELSDHRNQLQLFNF